MRMLKVVLPFWISISLLSLVQGAVVALPRASCKPPAAPAPARQRGGARGLARLQARGWAAIPPLSVILFVVVASAAQRASADTLTYVALVAVPVLAALALVWPPTRAPRWIVLAVPLLFALAWVDRGHLPGEGAALVLTALSCVALGMLIARVTPPLWLAAGIVAMALADTAFVVSDLLQKPNNALNAAHPAAGLPRLQSVVFGDAVMGYGDLFIAAALGALLVLSAGPALQRRAALLTALLALCFDLLFFFVDELPATVPVALTLLLLAARAAARRGRARVAAERRRGRRGRPDPARAPDPGPVARRDRARAAP
jgi:hypothetical protein